MDVTREQADLVLPVGRRPIGAGDSAGYLVIRGSFGGFTFVNDNSQPCIL